MTATVRPVSDVVSSWYDHIRTWQEGSFRLELWDTFQTGYGGKSRLAYEFFHDGQLIFAGDEFCASPLHSIDGDETVAALLHFLALRPGDTDKEYFDDYTEEQMTFALHHGEELWSLAYELEENARNADD